MALPRRSHTAHRYPVRSRGPASGRRKAPAMSPRRRAARTRASPATLPDSRTLAHLRAPLLLLPHLGRGGREERQRDRRDDGLRLSGSAERERIDEFEVDRHVRAEDLGERATDLRLGNAREARLAHDPEVHPRARLLHDLVAKDGVLVLLEEVREEGGRNVAAISAQHHALDAADDALEERQPAPAWAAAAGRHGEVAELVAEERDATVVQVGHEHLADLAVGCRPAVAYHLHDVALGVHVVSTVRLALVRDTAELPRAVLV